jgi:hypothetical protein
MKRAAAEIPGYTYGSAEVSPSPVSLQDLSNLKTSVGWTDEDERWRRAAGEVLADQTQQIVAHWRGGIIAFLPHLARHSRTPEGEAVPEYQTKSGLRFEQWILDTCFRTYDRDWLDYQNEIALRHTSAKKNRTDGVNSTPFVPLRDIVAFIAVMNETIRPYLAARGHTAEDVERMHRAWRKSLQLQAALWSKPYAGDEW